MSVALQVTVKRNCLKCMWVLLRSRHWVLLRHFVVQSFGTELFHFRFSYELCIAKAKHLCLKPYCLQHNKNNFLKYFMKSVRSLIWHKNIMKKSLIHIVLQPTRINSLVQYFRSIQINQQNDGTHWNDRTTLLLVNVSKHKRFNYFKHSCSSKLFEYPISWLNNIWLEFSHILQVLTYFN